MQGTFAAISGCQQGASGGDGNDWDKKNNGGGDHPASDTDGNSEYEPSTTSDDSGNGDAGKTATKSLLRGLDASAMFTDGRLRAKATRAKKGIDRASPS